MFKSTLKNHLKSLTKEQVIDLVLQVYDNVESAREFIEYSFNSDKDEEFEEPELPEKFKPLICEIAENIDSGLVCFLNPNTLEIDSYPSDLLEEVNLFDGKPKKVRKTMKELYGVDNVRVLDWDNYFEFSPSDSYEGFRIMEAFTQQLNEGKLQNQLIEALNNRKPFANFKNIIDYSNKRQEWFDFKRKWLENSVARELLDKLSNSD